MGDVKSRAGSRGGGRSARGRPAGTARAGRAAAEGALLNYAGISGGLPARSVKHLIGEGRLTEADLRRVVPPRTFQRRLQKDENLRLDEADAVARLVRVRDHAVRVFDTAERADLWLTEPNPALDGLVPIEMARTDVGAREVETVLGRIEHGVFS